MGAIEISQTAWNTSSVAGYCYSEYFFSAYADRNLPVQKRILIAKIAQKNYAH